MSPQETTTDETPESTDNFSVIVDTDTLGVALDALGATHEEAVLAVTEDGINAAAVDAATVMMCEVDVSQDAFEAWDPSPIEIGLRMPAFRNAALAGDVTEVELDAETRKINVESGPLDAELSPLDPDSIVTHRASEDVLTGTEAEWTMDYDTFNDAITHASRFEGGVLQLHVGDGFHGFRKTGDIDDVDVDFGDDVEWHDEPDDRQIVLLNEDYLKSIRGAIPNDAEITCSAKTEWPFIIEYTSHGVDVRFVVAPRIENN